jgi:hypothetical protein
MVRKVKVRSLDSVGDLSTALAQTIGAGTLIEYIDNAVASAGPAPEASQEDTWVGDNVVAEFAFTNIIPASAVAKPKRVTFYIDGLRQPASSYVIALSGITPNTVPVTGAELEAVYVS